MQPEIKNDLVYLLIILESAGKIEIYSQEFKIADEFYLAHEQLNFNACLMLLSNIGEQVKKISTELKNKHAIIEWKKIRGVRNRITHDYTGVDFEITFAIIKKELTELKSQIEEIIRSELAANNFDKEELDIARSSDFYSHVDFGAMS